MRDYRSLPQAQLLQSVMLGACEARLAYQRHEATHEARLNALCGPKSPSERARHVLLHCKKQIAHIISVKMDL